MLATPTNETDVVAGAGRKPWLPRWMPIPEAARR